MPINIHPSLSLSADLQMLTEPLLSKLGCNYFQYLKVFKDGSFSLVTTQPAWTQFTLDFLKNTSKPAVYSHIDAEQLDKNMFTFLWEPNLPQEPVTLARQFNISHGMTFVERHEEYYYMIAFGAPNSHHRAVDTYFNSLNEMSQFIAQFKCNHQKFIDEIDKHRLFVPKSRQDANLDKMLLDCSKQFKSNNPAHYLTAQELACLQGLANGKTYKEIALQLQISPRTVETYLNRIRARFNVRYKRELIALLSR